MENGCLHHTGCALKQDLSWEWRRHQQNKNKCWPSIDDTTIECTYKILTYTMYTAACSDLSWRNRLRVKLNREFTWLRAILRAPWWVPAVESNARKVIRIGHGQLSRSRDVALADWLPKFHGGNQVIDPLDTAVVQEHVPSHIAWKRAPSYLAGSIDSIHTHAEMQWSTGITAGVF
jgi:hypothetical protein